MKATFKLASSVLLTALVIQGLHMVEHVAQVIQKFALGWSAAHGILGAWLDIEPVHFVYNLVYLILVALIFIFYRKLPGEKNKLMNGLLLFTVVFQSWHFVEHVVKLRMHFVEGCVACPGIVGLVINPVVLHFSYNLIVFVPLILAALAMRKKYF